MAAGQENSKLTKSQERLTAELYQQTVLDPSMRRIVAKAITIGFNVALDGEKSAPGDRAKTVASGAYMDAATDGGIWRWLGVLCSRGPDIKDCDGAIMVANVVLWVVDRELVRLPTALSGIRRTLGFMLCFMWILHDTLITRILPNAHFVTGVPLSDAVSGTLSAVFLTVLFGLGFHTRVN